MKWNLHLLYVKNGQIGDMRNNYGRTYSELVYKNISYISHKGYGVFANDPECMPYEIAFEVMSYSQFSLTII